MMRTIIYVSGSRADFGLMKSTLIKLHLSSEFDLKLIITGMHLNEQHGYTIREVEKYNFNILGTVDCFPENDTTAGMSKSLGEIISRITTLLEKNRIDLVLLQGDRGEQLAGAIVAAHLNIPICHVSGGDITGSIDDKIRNAISMFTDIHCPATEFSANRLIDSLNIKEEDVHIVGEPGLDDLVSFTFMDKDQLFDKFELNKDLPLFLIIQHPVTDEVDEAGKHMQYTMKSIAHFKANKIIIYPNSDSGSQEIIRIIEQYQDSKDVLTIKNLNRDDFFNVMKHCDVMIGNSSAGIVEAPSLHKPVINIGTRQHGRLQAKNIINVNYNSNEISRAIEKTLNDEEFHKFVESAKNPYGSGNSSELIFSLLKEYFTYD